MLNDVQEALDNLFTACAEAMYNDCELNIGGNGVNPCEAARAYDAVADVLNMQGPTRKLDIMYENDEVL